MRSWVKWCINHRAKFLVYLVWLIVLPLYWIVYLPEAAQDAIQDLKDINKMKGE
jgi:hypothetical protein